MTKQLLHGSSIYKFVIYLTLKSIKTTYFSLI